LDILGLIAIPALIVLNGLFVAAEFSLVAIRRTRVEELVKQGARGAKSAEAALVHLDRTIAATQLGITLASVALGWVGEPAFAKLIEPLFNFLPEGWKAGTIHTIATMLALLGITFVVVIFGELFPKTVALQSTEGTALLLAKPLNAFARISWPILRLMNAIANWLLKRFGFKPAGTRESVHSVEELQILIEDTQEAGLLHEEQAEFVQNVFELPDKKVRDCMVPRDKMDAIEIRTPSEKVLEVVRRSGHTRIPVYDGELNKIVGILNTKNLFYYLTLQSAVVLDDCLYPATFLDPEETLDNALRLFRRSRRPMALVRDEAGHIHGLITLEDVIEEIVGDIEDEHDAPVPRLRRRSRRTATVTRLPASPPPPTPPGDRKPQAGT
jgi:CBS domain containing-hemolysin-like protein